MITYIVSILNEGVESVQYQGEDEEQAVLVLTSSKARIRREPTKSISVSISDGVVRLVTIRNHLGEVTSRETHHLVTSGR